MIAYADWWDCMEKMIAYANGMDFSRPESPLYM